MLKGAVGVTQLSTYTASRPDLPWVRGAWLLQSSVECELGANVCLGELYQMVILLIVLCIGIVTILCLFTYFKEDKDEQITPLCPQMVVNISELTFKLTLPCEPENGILTVVDLSDRPINNVVIEYKEPGSVSGVMAQVWLQDLSGKFLATMQAVQMRDKAAAPLYLNLFRGSEPFGSVEMAGEGLYYVRHRNGMHLLTLSGNFAEWNVEGTNRVGSKVCGLKQIGKECRGFVHQQVDAGLVITSLMAVHVHQQLRSLSAMEADVPAAVVGEAVVEAPPSTP